MGQNLHFFFTLLFVLFLSYPLYSDNLYFQNIESAIQPRKEWQSLVAPCKQLDSLNIFITKEFRQKAWRPKDLGTHPASEPRYIQKACPKADPLIASLNFMTTHLRATFFSQDLRMLAQIFSFLSFSRKVPIDSEINHKENDTANSLFFIQNMFITVFSPTLQYFLE